MRAGREREGNINWGAGGAAGAVPVWCSAGLVRRAGACAACGMGRRAVLACGAVACALSRCGAGARVEHDGAQLVLNERGRAKGGSGAEGGSGAASESLSDRLDRLEHTLEGLVAVSQSTATVPAATRATGATLGSPAPALADAGVPSEAAERPGAPSPVLSRAPWREDGWNLSVTGSETPSSGVSVSQASLCALGGIDTTAETRAWNIMSYALGAVQGAVGLVLLFGGVAIPRLSTFLTLLWGFGAVGFSLVWFLGAGPHGSWWVPYLIAYGGGGIVGIPVAAAGACLPIGSLYSACLLGGVAFMTAGIMFNTAGLFSLVHPAGSAGPWYTFSICAGSMLALGLLVYGFVGGFRELDRRDLATFAYCLVGCYLVVKMGGISAGQYPCEWGPLWDDPLARTTNYYIMFGVTFVCVPLFFLLQRRLYPASADDPFQHGGVVTSSQRIKGNDQGSGRAMPQHASQRILLSSGAPVPAPADQQPVFGGLYQMPAVPLASQSQSGADRYVATLT